jgi:hypothetical protein
MADLRRMLMVAFGGVAVLTATACHASLTPIPADSPSFRGRVAGFQLESASTGPGGLRLLRMRSDGSTSGGPESGYARVDERTQFVTGLGAFVDWNRTGLRDLVGASVRVWYHGRPTSETPTEVWGDARLIVVDETDSLTRQVPGFMARYAQSMRTGDRAALVAAYAPTGVRLLRNGRSAFQSTSDLTARYDSLRWTHPATFEWKDLSWERVGPDAVLVSGGYVTRASVDDPPRVFSYSALLRRRDGILRIAMEHVSSAPDAAAR